MLDGRLTMKKRPPSSAWTLPLYLLLFLIIGIPATAFVPSGRIFSTVLTKYTFTPSSLPPLMAFKPLAFVNENMKSAGPIATLGLSLPHLQDLSMENIQRVGETSLAAMVGIAAVQGALVCRKGSKHHAVPVSSLTTCPFRSCTSIQRIQPEN